MGFQGDAEVTVEVEERGGGEGDLSLSLELLKSLKAPELQGDDMLGGQVLLLSRRDRRKH